MRSITSEVAIQYIEEEKCNVLLRSKVDTFSSWREKRNHTPEAIRKCHGKWSTGARGDQMALKGKYMCWEEI